MRLKSDLLAVLIACVEGRLHDLKLDWHPDPALVVVMATHGYPGHYGKGSVIHGLDQAAAHDGVCIFHAGTKQQGRDIVADGGRVLGIGARSDTFAAAQHRAYEAVDRISWPEGFCRRDIGWRAVGA
jgi:phosphoribosylamine--glycine ligase